MHDLYEKANAVETRISPLPQEAGPPPVRLSRHTTGFVKQRTIIVKNRFRRSHSVNNSCGLTPMLNVPY